MENLKDILRCHAARYPLMEPRDAVKLIYQNEFGAAHLISDEAAARAALAAEYAATVHDGTALRCEEIGGGIARIHLAALRKEELDGLAEAFFACAKERRGSLGGLRKKLRLLTKLAEEGTLPFSAASLSAFLADYEKAGFPALSHSEAYRKAYRPAYRIVCLAESE